MKGKENKAADCLSRLFPVIDPSGDETQKSDLESDLPSSKIIGEYEKMDPHPEFNSRQEGRMAADDLISDEEDLPDDQERLYRDYLDWQKDKRVTREVKKPNAYGKLRKIITKSELREYQEESWLKLLSLQIQGFLCEKLTIVRLQFPDPTITPLEKFKIQEIIGFLFHLYPALSFHTCYTAMRESTNDEKEQVIRKAHGSIMAQHYGENKTIERARTIGEWRNMEEEIIYCSKRCPVCQLQKTTRIKNQSEAVIPDTPVDPNDKISMDIFGRLSTTRKGHNYILSIQDQLTKYLILILLKDAEAESNIQGHFDHYIYIFGAPKHILTDQGATFVSELVQNPAYKSFHLPPTIKRELRKITLDSKRFNKNMYGR